MVEFAFAFCLLIGGGIANMASEDLFREKEAHLICYIQTQSRV